MNNEKQSPIKITPLRQAGESLTEKRDEILYEKISPVLDSIIVIFIIGFVELYHYYFNAQPNPLACFIAGVILIAFYYKRILADFGNIKNINLGIQGERTVEEMLQSFQREGYYVFSDLRNGQGNIDHILIGPAGVFTVETKARRKGTSKAKISFDGNNLLVNGYPDDNVIRQAHGEKYWLEKFISGEVELGAKVVVQPIIIYPGWFIDQKCKQADIWIIPSNAKWLRNCLKSRGKILDDKQIGLLSYLIGNYIRNHKVNL